MTPTKKTNQAVLKKVEQFWKAIGSRVLRLTPEIHDSLVSRSSHLRTSSRRLWPAMF